MAKKDSKKHLLDHSEAKVSLLSEYLNRYLNVIANDGFTRKIHVFDLFCGEGKYDNGGFGSPLIIMRAINDLFNVNLGQTTELPIVNALFNDIDSDKVAKVKKVIAEYELGMPGDGVLAFKSEDYKDLLRKIEIRLQKLNNEKAFVFIDPYEYKHIRISHIKQLIVNGKTEVLIWLPTHFMYRFESNGTPTALKDFLGEIVPYENWDKSTSTWKFVESLKNGFQNAIGKDYFVDSFTIQKDKNTVFCLFFFTSHIRGFEKMLEAKWKIDDEEGRGWVYTGNNPSLFYNQKTNKLEEKLINFMSSKPRSNGELYNFTLKNRFLPSHANQVLSSLQTNDKLEVIRTDGGKVRKKSFYINYDNYKNSPDKVLISTK